jgi:hypothetical protein
MNTNGSPKLHRSRPARVPHQQRADRRSQQARSEPAAHDGSRLDNVCDVLCPNCHRQPWGWLSNLDRRKPQQQWRPFLGRTDQEFWKF